MRVTGFSYIIMEKERLRQLLDLAAKAVGGTLSEGQGKRRTGPTWETWEWCGEMGINLHGKTLFPQSDDGHSRLLEVALGLCVRIDLDDRFVRVICSGVLVAPVHSEPLGADPRAATRLAVLRAAAAIGESMP